MTDYEFYHHGIKGQSWGKMHGPPYPLDSSVSTGNKLKWGERRYVKKLIKKEERKSARRIKKLNKKHNEEVEDLRKVEEKYNKKYDKAKTDKKRAKINKKYAKKLHKEYEESKEAEFNLKDAKERSENMIKAYSSYTSKDISADKKAKAKAKLEIAIGFVPVVGTVYSVTQIPSDYKSGYQGLRDRQSDYKKFRREDNAKLSKRKN